VSLVLGLIVVFVMISRTAWFGAAVASARRLVHRTHD